MTHNDYTRLVKIFGIMLLCVIPILICINLLLTQVTSMGVLIAIDSVLLVAGFCIAYVIAEKRRVHIARKREEFLMKQKEEQKNKKAKGE